MRLAGAVRKVYDAAKQVRAANPQPKESFGGNPLPDKNSISTEPLNKIFGVTGDANNGMAKFTFGRPATMHGVKIDNTMGVNTWAAFAGSDDNAVVDGDFAVTEDELQPVLKSLLKEKINIVAIHQHMTHEEPRIMFFHYWGTRPAKDLAQAIKGGFLIGGLLRSQFTTARLNFRDLRTRLRLALRRLLLFAGSEAVKAQGFLKTVADVPLPGGTTRFDYQSLDPSTGRLYLSHMGDGNVVVFDTKTNKVLANVPGFPTVTGVLVVPALKSVYASVTHNHEIAVLDTEKLVVS